MTKPQERQALYPGTEVPGLYGPILVSTSPRSNDFFLRLFWFLPLRSLGVIVGPSRDHLFARRG